MQSEIADLRDRLESEQLARNQETSAYCPFDPFSCADSGSLDAKLKLQTELQDLKVTSVTSSAKHSGELIPSSQICSM